MSMYDMVDTTPEGYSEGEELSKMFSEDDMSEAFEERDIDVITEEINFYKQQAGMAILEIGKRLVEAKAQLSHGEWLPWLEKKVEFSERSAQQYIRLWKEYGKSATVADLGVRKALVLLALPENERDSALDAAKGYKAEAEAAHKLAAAASNEDMTKFKVVFDQTVENVNTLAALLQALPDSQQEKLRRALLALADQVRKVGA